MLPQRSEIEGRARSLLTENTKMSHSTINKPLTSRLLDGLDTEGRTAILRVAQEQRFSADSVIVNQAHRAEHLFLLTHGHARHFFNTESG
jgi:hypothetical protein